jgi:hypothetical protein
MKLKDLLQWEVPQASIYGGSIATPKLWIVRAASGAYVKIIVNRRWMEENEPGLAKAASNIPGKGNDMKRDIGVSVAIDREKKQLRLVFDPPEEVPHYIARQNLDNSGTVTINNRMLGEDLWLLLDMPAKAIKQFFNYKVEQEIEGKKIYLAWYEPKSSANLNALIPSKKRNYSNN